MTKKIKLLAVFILGLQDVIIKAVSPDGPGGKKITLPEWFKIGKEGFELPGLIKELNGITREQFTSWTLVSRNINELRTWIETQYKTTNPHTERLVEIVLVQILHWIEMGVIIAEIKKPKEAPKKAPAKRTTTKKSTTKASGNKATT